MSGICMDCRQLSVSDTSYGFTDTALGFLNLIQGELKQTQSVTAPIKQREDLLSELIEIHEECKEDNWDDEGAVAINSGALFEAISFIRLLPSQCVFPEVVPSANGAINFEWRKDNAIFNIELTGSSEIIYSGYFSKYSRDYGMKPFVGAIPENVIRLIERMS